MLIFAALSYEDTGTEYKAGGPGSRSAGADSLDELLIVRIGRGEREAFENLYEQISNAVYAYAYSLLLNRESAEDVMQETFLKIRAAAHLYKPRGRPMAWIITITRNLCMMRFRQERRQTELLPDHLEAERGLSEIEEAEDRMVLKSALEVLTKEELRIIVLHAVSGMKHREISEVMHIPLSTVLSRYQRGLGKLRKRLEEAEL
ncbi:MAG: RNA polymerase sigma factor [Lachnospiraceae bacterium]|nr:RNA polymerase sigma factor [Lachnospiraceae bacterium]